MCSAANDHLTRSWSGTVTLSAFPMTSSATSTGSGSWSRDFSVDDVKPGTAARFFVGKVPGAGAATDAVRFLRGVSCTQAACAEFGMPLVPLKSLVENKALPAATVTATASPAAGGRQVFELQAHGAAALHVHATSPCLGAFNSSGFHLPLGTTQRVAFVAWPESTTPCPPGASLRVEWLNRAPSRK